ncbi:MAG: glycosyltransferase family 39 protein [Bryobacterales bacterium]|nr:glycosyltransferase family 39 protein [Bryobacterales bacterium]
MAWLDPVLVVLLLAAVGTAALWWHLSHGYTLYFGDAQAHMVNARRMVDSRTPGWDQLGTVWLPMPHWLMLPFVSNDEWWRTGLAGAIPSSACFVLSGTFLYLAVRRLFHSRAAAGAAVLLLALNPNVLYTQSIPMTEMVFLAGFSMLLYASVWHAQGGGLGAALLAGVASNIASLTRYEGWFLIPFVALYFVFGGKNVSPWKGIVFGAVAALGPLWWLAHNLWYYSDPLEFYRGQWSAKMIYQRALDAGMDRYPGDHDLPKAWSQFRAAAQLCAGASLVVLGLAGVVTTLFRRAFAALGLLLLPVGFYVWSIYSSGTPIFVPHLWPNSYYNTRYGLAAFPALAVCAASLATIARGRWQTVLAALVVATATVPWLAYPRTEAWITWKESQVNSEARRAWTAEAAAYLNAHRRPHEGIYSALGDLAGIYREAGIPLREVLQEGNNPHWLAVQKRPDLFLREEWAVAISGDEVSTAILKSNKTGPRYVCVKMITGKGAPVIEIYRRDSQTNEDTLYQGTRRPE